MIYDPDEETLLDGLEMELSIAMVLNSELSKTHDTKRQVEYLLCGMVEKVERLQMLRQSHR